MLTPSITNPTTQFYALGNTPATNLAKCLPSGVDAIILLLGCGDARNILFTTYCERGLPSRKLDFVCCDIVEDIHARNIVLFTFLLDGVSGRSLDALWDIYYHLYLDDEAMTLFHSQLKKLRSLSETLDEWRAGPYGPFLRFCDPATFDDFRRILAKYDDAVKSQESPSYKISFHSSISSSKELMRSRFGSGAAAASAARSAAPLGLKSLGDVKGAFRHYWENGTSGPKRPDEKTPNPMFAVSVSDNTLLHYGTDPVQGFHLATGFADLAEASPLRPNKKESELFKAVGAAKTQFREWARAFQAIKERMVIRVVTSDALVLCHTLQHRLSSGHTRRSAHWFRRQLEMQKLELDALDYGQRENEVQEAKGLTVPLKFDVIDTSNLGDHIGTLNLLVAAAPILTNTPFSTVQTELLIRREASEKETFDKLLCGHGPTMAALLGLTPAEYYTNATTVSSVDELLLSVGAGTSGDDLAGQQLRSQISWKLSHHFTGRSRFQTALNIDAQDLAKILFTAYHNMFEFESISSFMDSGKLSMDKIRNSTYPFFHRGSLVALMRYVEHRVKTDWTRTCQTLIDTIYQDRKLVIGTNYVQDLALHMHMWGVHSESWIKHDIERNSRSTGGISSWKHIPEIVAVTLIVPRAKFGRLFSPGVDKRAAPILQISMRSSQGAAKQWHNFFSDVHLVFGDATPRGHRDSHDLVLKIDEDPDGWAGRSPLLVCFYAPSCALQVEPRTALIGLSLQQTIQNMSVYSNVIGPELSVYETTLGDESRVFFTKFLPGQDAYPTVSPPLTHHAGRGQKKKELEKASLTANIDQGTGKIISMTGHTDIQSPQGKKLLEDKVPIELRQSSPFVIDAIFGDGILVYPIQFAVAVVKDGSRMRIARKSSYVDVIAPLADPITTNGLADLIFPSTLDLYNKSTTLSIPHVNPDGLPILELADRRPYPGLRL